MTGQLVKAMLTTTDAGAAAINFQFNPTELSFKRAVSINEQKGARTESGLPKVSFAYRQPVTITLKLIFDTYETGTSVLTLIEPILKATDFTGTLSRPPVYVFAWGKEQYLRCFVTSVDYDLTMFLADGTPVRASVTMSLQEVDRVKDYSLQNPKNPKNMAKAEADAKLPNAEANAKAKADAAKAAKDERRIEKYGI